MNLEKLDLKISNFIKKYDFLSDPIFLFNIKDIPSEKDFYKKELNLDYPIIDNALENIDFIKDGYINLIKEYENTNFGDNFLKNEYKKRIQKINEIIRLIEIFYKKHEKEKFELIINYFGIDLDFCKNEVLKNYFLIEDEFKKISKKSYLFDDLYYKCKDFQNKDFNAKDIKRYFEEALKYLNIKDYWDVEITDNVVSIVHGEFTGKGGKIFIPKDKIVSFERLIVLIVHEIDCHCMQFTNDNEYQIFKGNIRFADSEEILEGFAIYIENCFNILFFKENKYKNRYKNLKLILSFISKDISLKFFLDNYSMENIRIFRGFKNIEKYVNTKDLVYTQGLYKIIKYKNLYQQNFFNCIFKGVINEKYILKDCKNSEIEYNITDFLINTSAFNILNKFIS